MNHPTLVLQDLTALLARLIPAKVGDAAFDAAYVAILNNCTLRPYPPSDDFGPKDRWQFWSRDGAHFIGNEKKFPVKPITRSVDVGISLVPPDWRLYSLQEEYPTGGTWFAGLDHRQRPAQLHSQIGKAPTPALALAIAIVYAAIATTSELGRTP